MNVTITSDAERRLWALVRSVKTEIGGWGYATLDDEGNLLWDETFLIPQIVSGSEVDFDETNGDDVAIQRALNDGKLADPNFVWVSWHSHHTMKAFWSSTDDTRIEKIGAAGVTRLLSFVGCHDGEYRLRFDAFGVEAHGVNIGQVTISDMKLLGDPDDEFTADISRELAANVSKRTFKPVKFQQQGKGKKLPATTPLEAAADAEAAREARTIQLEASYGGRRLSITEAFDVKELLDAGFTYVEALEWMDHNPTAQIPFSVDDVEGALS